MHDSFITLTLLTLGAALLAWLCQKLRLSPILGYLLLGVLAGPFQQHIFSDKESASALAELGVVLLMFFIGLEFHLGEVRSLMTLFLGGGSVQVLATAALAGGVAWLSGVPPMAAGVTGLMLAFSSTALVVKAFEEKGEADSQRARAGLAVLLFQDIAAILAVVLLPVAASIAAPKAAAGTGVALSALGKLGLPLVVLPVLFLGARRVLPRLFDRAAAARAPEAFSLLGLGVCLSVALAAQLAGTSLALGAFLGGLVLSGTPFAFQILSDLSMVRNLALAFFFMTIGLLVDASFVASHWLPLLGALAALVVLKALLTGGILLVFRVPLGVAAGTGLALAQVGEFSFVLGRQAVAEKLLSSDVLQCVLALAIGSLMLTPFLVGRSAHFGAWLAGRFGRRAVGGPEAPHAEGIRAVVVGYGPVGRTLTRILMDFGITPLIVDMNIDTVKKLQAAGVNAVYGDAGRREILRAAGVEGASYLLVTLPDLAGRIPVVAMARLLNPSIKIVTRARYLGERAMLEEAGATAINYEEAEIAVALAEFLLHEVNASAADIEREAKRIRDEIAVRPEFTVVVPKKT